MFEKGICPNWFYSRVMFEAHCISAFSIFVQSLVPEVMLSQNKNFYIAVYCSPYSYLFFCFTYTLNSGIFNIIILLNISLVTLFFGKLHYSKIWHFVVNVNLFYSMCLFVNLQIWRTKSIFFWFEGSKFKQFFFSIFKNIVTISCVFNFWMLNLRNNNSIVRIIIRGIRILLILNVQEFLALQVAVFLFMLKWTNRYFVSVWLTEKKKK